MIETDRGPVHRMVWNTCEPLVGGGQLDEFHSILDNYASGTASTRPMKPADPAFIESLGQGNTREGKEAVRKGGGF